MYTIYAYCEGQKTPYLCKHYHTKSGAISDLWKYYRWDHFEYGYVKDAITGETILSLGSCMED